MMNKFLFVAVLTFIGSFCKAQDIKVEFPSVILADTEQTVRIHSKKNIVFVAVGAQGDSLQVTDGLAEITIVPKSNDYLSLSVNGINHSSTTKAIPLWLSIIPPLLAIVFAFFFGEVLLSLLGGVFIGVAIMGYYAQGWMGVVTALFKVVTDYQVPAIANAEHVSILLFTFFIGGMITVVSKNGGVAGLVKMISHYAKTSRSGQLTTYFLGLIVFFDDYTNTLVVGNTMRPVMDKLKVSREKLSYIVDSTAAPLVAIAFVGTWVGAELNYIQSGLESINQDGIVITQSPYQILLSSLAFSFYPILTLVFVLMLILQQREYGPMYDFENHVKKDDYLFNQKQAESERYICDITVRNASNPNLWFALVPIIVLVVTVLVGIVITGYSAEACDSVSGMGKVSTIMGNADVFVALLWSSFLAIGVAVGMSIVSKRLTNIEATEAVMDGIKGVIPVSAILILAWCLAQVTQEMHTADFLISLLSDHLSPRMVPTITFLLAGTVAFATGTSWGTMAILYPIIIPASYILSAEAGMPMDQVLNIFLISVASVLAGAVFGDHCSPISDTTILSSLASGCNHINHVRTQIPYALTVAAVALFFGIIPASYGISSWITMPIAMLVMYLVIRIIGKKIHP